MLLRSDRPADALPHLEAAVRQSPDNAEAQNHLGIALARLGRAAEAMVHFEAALRLKPELTEAEHNLALLRQALERP